MYHNVLPLEAGVCNSQTNPPQQHTTKGVMITKLSQTQKDALPQTDAISNKSTRTIRSIKTINLKGTTSLGTRLNLNKDVICPSIATGV